MGDNNNEAKTHLVLSNDSCFGDFDLSLTDGKVYQGRRYDCYGCQCKTRNGYYVGGFIFCETCFNKTHVLCEKCEARMIRSNLVPTENDEYLCGYCS